MKSISLNIIILVFVIFNTASAALYDVKPSAESVNFLAKGKPSFIAIKGMGQGLTGKVETTAKGVKADLEFDLTSLDTGIELRDDHLKNKYLEVATYPKARLIIKEENATLDGEKVTFKGLLTLHGVEREVSGEGVLTNSNLKAEFSLDLTDFKIEIPSFQGITVAKTVVIKVESPLALNTQEVKSE